MGQKSKFWLIAEQQFRLFALLKVCAHSCSLLWVHLLQSNLTFQWQDHMFNMHSSFLKGLLWVCYEEVCCVRGMPAFIMLLMVCFSPFLTIKHYTLFSICNLQIIFGYAGYFHISIEYCDHVNCLCIFDVWWGLCMSVSMLLLLIPTAYIAKTNQIGL